MKKLILMAVCLVLGNVCITVPAIADCSWESGQARRNCEEQEARTEYMKQESKLMRERAKMLEKCNGYNPPSYCK
ncbi:hypothetical protein [Ruminobacter sp. RM87]|uniref:hypothetical protein n=1 Tax=Ruminobacter sp. RM87 TaxID=1200567 RepID=UPI0004E22631|nr:hypothetical protein [Ruminobacter sp. RM87]